MQHFAGVSSVLTSCIHAAYTLHRVLPCDGVENIFHDEMIFMFPEKSK